MPAPARKLECHERAIDEPGRTLRRGPRVSRISLDPVQARALGVLLEKQITTPDAYPLSLNALVAGCNQKSNRDPVMTLGEAAVRDAVEALVAATLAREQGSAGGRTRRFSHRLDSRLFGELEFSREERAVLCVLLLRGPQTPGEIRARTDRLAQFADLAALEAVIERLAGRADGPHVEALAREPGRREVRYRQLFCTQGAPAAQPQPYRAAPPSQASAARPEADALQALEARLRAAEARIAALEALVVAPGLAGSDGP
jgi:hypothetical protein